MSILVRGWPKITEALGLKTEEAAKGMVSKYRLPIVYLNGWPTTTEAAIERWFAALTEKIEASEKR